MPVMARHSYALEMRTTLAFAFMLTCFETSVIGVVIKIRFEDVLDAGLLNLAVAIVASAKAFSNITSFVWVRLSHGADKVAFVGMLQIIMLGMCALLALAFIPKTELGLWSIVVIIVLARCVWAGVITLRSTIWRQNYRRRARARITGKITAAQVVALGVIGAVFGLLMDRDPRFFYLFAGLAVLIGPLGVISWRSMRVRRRKALASGERTQVEAAPTFNPLSMLRVLRADRPFAHYMGCMFLLGSGNLMIPTLLPIMTRERFGLDNFEGILIASTIPALLMPLAIPVWARMLDRMHVIHFRFIQCWFFFAAHALLLLAAILREPAVLYASSVVLGIAFGGGAIAWNLGHLDFAKPHQATQYMGIHVTLTGVRGLLAPLLGVGLYEILKQSGNGHFVLLITLSLIALAAMGFLKARRDGPAPGGDDDPREELEVAPPTRISQ